MFRAGDFFEDFARGFGPYEGLGIGIVLFQVFHDGRVQFGNAFEGVATDSVAGDLGEEPLDHIEPGRRGGREVQMEARMIF